jgi:hypothetical protein
MVGLSKSNGPARLFHEIPHSLLRDEIGFHCLAIPGSDSPQQVR